MDAAPTGDSRSGRAAGLVKFALAFGLLGLIMVALVDLGLDHGTRAAVNDAAEEASRAVAERTVGSDATCAVNGPAPDIETRALVCLAKRRTRMSDDRVAVKILSTAPTTAPNSDVTAARMPGDAESVVVCVAATADSISGLLDPVFRGRFHHARSVSDANGSADHPLPPPWEEAALTNGGVTDSWAWCTENDPSAST